MTSPSPEDTNDKMPLWAHLAELRRRLLYSILAIVLVFPFYAIFAEEIYAWFLKPLALSFPEGEARQIIYTSLPEAFMTYLKLGLFCSFALSFPFIGYQLWRFVAPGLYENERKSFVPFLIFSPFLFFAGVTLAYWGILPLAFQFFIGFENLSQASSLPLLLNARISQYISLTLSILFGFGICFQLPIVLVLLGRAGIISADGLKRGRKYAIVGVLGLAALMTPPDILSQVGLAVPLLILYEGAIVWLRMSPSKSESVEV